MYLNKKQEVIEDLSVFGHLSVGVPGSVDGMITMHKKLGVLPFGDLIQPAIDLANNGFALTEKEAKKLNFYRADFLNAGPPPPTRVHRIAVQISASFPERD